VESRKRIEQLEQKNEVLAPGDGLLRPRRPRMMICPLVTNLADVGIPVALTGRVLRFSKQAYDKRRAHPISQRHWDDAHLSTPRSTSTTTTPSWPIGSSPMSPPNAASRPTPPDAPAVHGGRRARGLLWCRHARSSSVA
jgi:hypothetical protein